MINKGAVHMISKGAVHMISKGAIHMISKGAVHMISKGAVHMISKAGGCMPPVRCPRCATCFSRYPFKLGRFSEGPLL